MSKIERLQIRGIRSFGSGGQNTIEFYAPLTLIVGHNGAGKTTIIECLKYITTGQMPPGSSGGAFIHDPKVAHETETKAQIKLRFTSASGLKMVCARSLVLSQKAGGKMQQKTLEGLLTTINPDTGEQVSTNAKCSTLDTEVPEHLGVSRAVLENVIFCHQEDSFWPLAEPAVLKKKFDDLFDATRYTKALDQLKSMRKEQANEIKLARQEVDFLKADRDRAHKIKVKLDKISADIKQGEDRIADLDVEIHALYSHLQEVMKDQQDILTLATQIDSLKHEVASIIAQEKELKASTEILTDTDEEMAKRLEEQNSLLRNSQAYLMEKEREKSDAESRLATSQKKLTDLASEKGKLMADMEANDLRVVDRDNIMKQLNQEYLLEIHFGDDISEVSAQSFMKAMLGKLESFREKASVISKDYDMQDRAVSDKVMSVTAQKRVQEEKKISNRKNKQDNIKKLSEISSQFSDIAGAGDTLQSLKSDFEQKEKELELSKQNCAQANFEAKIKNLERERSQIETNLSELKDEMATLNRYSETNARLVIKKADKEKKSDQIQRLVSGCLADIKRVFGAEVTAENFQQHIVELKDSRDKRIQKLQFAADKANMHVKTLETKLSLLRNEIKSKRKQAEDLEADLHMRWQDEAVDELLKRTDSELSEASHRLTFLESSSAAYADFQKLAVKKKHCPLCERDFDSSNELSAFNERLNEHINCAPKQTRELQQKVQELSEKKSKLSTDVPLYNKMKSLNDSVSSLLSEEASLSDELEDANNNSEDSQGEMAMIQMELLELQKLHVKLQDIDRYRKELAALEDEIQQVATELGFSGSTKTIDEVQLEVDNLDSKDKQLRRQIERTNNEMRMRQNDITGKEKKLSELKIEVMSLEHRMNSSGRLHEQRQFIMEENQKIDSFLKEVDDRIKGLDVEIKTLDEQRAVVRKNKEDQELKITHQIAALQQHIVKLENICKQIENFQTSGIQPKLQSNSKSSEKTKLEMESIQKEINLITKAITDAGKQKSELEVFERKVRDNLRLRKLTKDKADKWAQVTDLEEKQGNIDAEICKKNINDLNKKASVLNGERSSLEGSVQQLQLQKKQMKSDLRDDYDQIEERFKKSIVDCATLELANADLEKYAKAVDTAIMKFHSLKMDEINRTIKEFWMSTYRGHDIDAIEIRSDAESARGNRSYNYRVVMLKGGVVLDMRGRCSAGQKVLASLIIRLALAESFCHHCGILALDEPTTNLDEDNVESLALSLKHLIDHRRTQSNFQLLIISHDEKFVQSLGDHADFYHRVYKDADGLSCIERKRMDEH